MPDGTVPSSTEALRAALSAAKASLEGQVRTSRSDAADDALRQIKSALQLLPSERRTDFSSTVIADAEWIEAAIESPVAPVPEPETRDDLTRIRGIDDILAKRLAAIGIQRFCQIAAWQLDDVRIIADAMGLGRRFLAMGIVEQAVELDRQKTEAHTRLAQPALSMPQQPHAVAVWEPKAPLPSCTPTPLVRTHAPWRPLAGDDLRHARSLVRQPKVMNTIVTLEQLVPALATPIYVATDHDASIELPRWRTGVLVPFVEPSTKPDLARLGDKPSPQIAPSNPPPPARTIIAALPEPRMQTDTAPVQRRPLHEEAATRLNDLEAEINDIVVRPSPHKPAATDVIAATTMARPRIATPAAESVRAPVDHSIPNDAEEANVEIVTGARRQNTSMLAPMPALPLTPGQRRTERRPSRATKDQPTGPVEEAAVVIVRRNSEERSAADLAFYKAAPPVGRMRRFMRAIAGT